MLFVVYKNYILLLLKRKEIQTIDLDNCVDINILKNSSIDVHGDHVDLLHSIPTKNYKCFQQIYKDY